MLRLEPPGLVSGREAAKVAMRNQKERGYTYARPTPSPSEAHPPNPLVGHVPAVWLGAFQRLDFMAVVWYRNCTYDK